MLHIIKPSRERMGYPVGDYMPEARAFVAAAAEKLNELDGSVYYNIFCRGSSGAMLSALLSVFISGHCLIHHFKKPYEDSHSPDWARPLQRKSKNVIIDDHIYSGNTLAIIHEEIKKKWGLITIHHLILENAVTEAHHIHFEPENIITIF